MPGTAADKMVKREMVTLLLCGSGVDDTSMQDLFYTMVKRIIGLQS